MDNISNKEIVELYLDEVARIIVPEAQVKFKKESWILRTVRPILEVFNKGYWDGYITTLGNTMYVPDSWFERGDAKSLLSTTAHEVIHMYQAKRQSTFVHDVLYLFPQVLAVLALLAFLAIPFGLGWLWTLLFLLFLLPLPAPFRYMKELEAYRVKILFFKHAYAAGPDMMQWAKDGVIQNLAKSDYYFCWPFPSLIQKDLDKSEQFFEEPQYKEILDFLKRHNLTLK